MSSSNRTTSKGGKGAKAEKSHKTDGGKGGGDKIHSKENASKNDELSIKEKVKQLMELTRRSEDEVCLALHESDNDVTVAINLLFEEITTGEWETKDKKKKKRQASAGKDKKGGDDGNGGADDWDDSLPPPTSGNNMGSGDGKDWKERGGGRRGRGGDRESGPPRMGRGGGGWREDGRGGDRGDRRGGGRGSTRGGGGGRGRGGGRAGGRYPPRGNRGGFGGGRDRDRDYNKQQPIDTWDNSNTWDNSTAAATTNHAPAADDWDDFHTDEWSTEEYTGSLVETKVFTPSVQNYGETNALDPNAVQQPPQNPGLVDPNLSGSSQQEAQTYSQSLTYTQTVQQQQLPGQQSPVPPMVGTLTAAQTQYFSQLSQQNSDSLNKQYATANAPYQTQQQNTYEQQKSNVQPVYNNTSPSQGVYAAPTTQAYQQPAAVAAQQSYANSAAVPPQSYSSAAQPYAAAAATQPQSYSNTAQQTTYNSQQPQAAQQAQPYSQAAAQQSYASQPAQPYNNAVSQTYGATQQSYGSATAANNTYNSNYQTYNTGQEIPPTQQQQPQRTKTQRARVPPPSKIPSSAVEMPGDLNSSISNLDLQFGAMDLIDNSFDSNSTSDIKYGTENNRSATGMENSRSTPTSGLDLNSSTPSSAGATTLDAGGYASVAAAGAPPKNGSQSTISSALSQGLSNTESIPQTSEHLSYNNTAASTRSTSQGSNVTTSVPSAGSTPAPGLDLNKQQQQQSNATDLNSQYGSSQQPSQPAYNSYQSKPSSYSTSPYSTTQTTASSYVNPSAASYVSNQTNSYSASAAQQNTGSNSYGNAYSSTAAAAASAQQVYQNASSYQSVTQSTNSYQTSSQPSYAASAQNSGGQSVYGATTGLSNNTSNYSAAAASQYNSYNSTTSGSSHKMGQQQPKENSYDTSSSASATSTTASSNVSSAAALSSLSQSSSISSSKATATLAKNSTSVMSNIPPGVTPVMSTPYIMGQVPYFQQPVYSYEEMQLLQQRLPHMTTPYYDMGYQTPTTLATVRGDPTAALGGYGAATADGRFQAGGRVADGTTSPVPGVAASQQQQQQQQQQPAMLAGTGPPYFFATTFNTIPAPPNYAQFGTMYTQLPAVTNAHGSSAGSQYGPKPATYGSAGYGGYDALGQTAQDYAKGGYAVGSAAAAAAAAAAAQQAAQKGQVNSTTAGSGANDLSAMYGKSHAALGKVNSYEKQGFHSGTPPPFTGALSQSAGLAPSGTGYAPPVYIPTMPQHHSTMAMHQPLHDSGNSSGQRSQGSNQAKAGSKQGYGASYWNQN